MANQYQSDLTEQRKVAWTLLALGLATVAELANHWNLPRQTVARWAGGIDVAAARERAVMGAVVREGLRQAIKPRVARTRKVKPSPKPD